MKDDLTRRLPTIPTTLWEREWADLTHASEGGNYAFFAGALVSIGLSLDVVRRSQPSSTFSGFGPLPPPPPPPPRVALVDPVHWLLCAVFVGVAVRTVRARRRSPRVGGVRVLRGAWISCAIMAAAQTAIAAAVALLAADLLRLTLDDVPGTSAVLSSEWRVAASLTFVFALLTVREKISARRRLAPGVVASCMVIMCGLGGVVIGAVGVGFVLHLSRAEF